MLSLTFSTSSWKAAEKQFKSSTCKVLLFWKPKDAKIIICLFVEKNIIVWKSYTISKLWNKKNDSFVFYYKMHCDNISIMGIILILNDLTLRLWFNCSLIFYALLYYKLFDINSILWGLINMRQLRFLELKHTHIYHCVWLKHNTYHINSTLVLYNKCLLCKY